MGTPLNLVTTPVPQQQQQHNQSNDSSYSPVSGISFQPRRLPVSAVPPNQQQQRNSYVTSSCQETAFGDMNMSHLNNTSLYQSYPGASMSPSQPQQSVAKLFQMSHHTQQQSQGPSSNPTPVTGNSTPSGSVLARVPLNQNDSVGGLNPQTPQLSSTPFERLLPHHHQQIREQLKLLPPPQNLHRPPHIIDSSNQQSQSHSPLFQTHPQSPIFPQQHPIQFQQIPYGIYYCLFSCERLQIFS